MRAHLKATLLVGSLATAALGCGASQTQLLTRAEIELECPRDQLSQETLVDSLGSGKTVLVEGCGRRTTYVQMCDGSSGEIIRSCTWTH